MSEPFTIYERHGYYSSEYLVPVEISGETHLSHYPEAVAERKALAKRLSDAELAAIFWHADGFWFENGEAAIAVLAAKRNGKATRAQRIGTIHRFATTNSYDMGDCG